jgi:hypothetical protein
MTPAAPDLYALGNHIAQAKALARALHHASCSEAGPMDSETVGDCAALIVATLERAQSITTELCDHALIPVTNMEAWRKVQALQSELSANWPKLVTAAGEFQPHPKQDRFRKSSYIRPYIKDGKEKGLGAFLRQVLDFTGGSSLIRTGDLRIMIPSL